jgi:lipid-A-disaccharide synthase-like uncharacterized protein
MFNTIMAALRIFILSLLAASILWLLLATLAQGLRTGRIRYRDSTAIADRRVQPILYWFLVFAFATFVLIIAAAWWYAVVG